MNIIIAGNGKVGTSLALRLSEEGYNLELGSGSFIAGFEEGLVGAVAGEVIG